MRSSVCTPRPRLFSFVIDIRDLDFHQVGDARLNGGAIPEGALAGPEDPSAMHAFAGISVNGTVEQMESHKVNGTAY